MELFKKLPKYQIVDAKTGNSGGDSKLTRPQGRNAAKAGKKEENSKLKLKEKSNELFREYIAQKRKESETKQKIAMLKLMSEGPERDELVRKLFNAAGGEEPSRKKLKVSPLMGEYVSGTDDENNDNEESKYNGYESSSPVF